jgi:hypothetical protein
MNFHKNQNIAKKPEEKIAKDMVSKHFIEKRKF